MTVVAMVFIELIDTFGRDYKAPSISIFYHGLIKSNTSMKKSDLYEIAVKIMGLYLVILVISQFRDVLMYATMVMQQNGQENFYGDYNVTASFVVLIIGWIALAGLAMVLIFGTGKVVRVICKIEDYEEDVKLFADKKSLYLMTLQIGGMLILLLTLPDFIIQLRKYIILVQSEISANPRNFDFLLTAGLKILAGILALVYAHEIAGSLARDKKPADSEVYNDQVDE